MILDTVNRKLQIALATAQTSLAMPVAVDYVDMTTTSTTPGMQLSSTNGITAVDILAAPAASTQRKVNSITVYNKDTAQKVVQIWILDTATPYQLVDVTLQVDDTLCYTDVSGWFVQDVNGNRKTSNVVALVNIDGGFANAVYTSDQAIDGGAA